MATENTSRDAPRDTRRAMKREEGREQQQWRRRRGEGAGQVIRVSCVVSVGSRL
jgi:hypothetical protein